MAVLYIVKEKHTDWWHTQEKLFGFYTDRDQADARLNRVAGAELVRREAANKEYERELEASRYIGCKAAPLPTFEEMLSKFEVVEVETDKGIVFP